MIKIYGIIFFLFVFSVSCAQEKQFKDIKFKKIKTCYFKHNGEFSVKNLQYIGKNKIIVNIFTSNKLYILDVSDNSVKLSDSINIPNIEINKIQGFHYINDDSIFVLLGTIYEDTALILINSKGKIIRNNYLQHPLIYKMYANQGFYPLIYFFNNLVVANNKVLMPVYFVPYTRSHFASEQFYKHTYPLVAYYDLKADSITFLDKIWYSFLRKDYFYPENYRFIGLSKTFDNNLLISFSYALTFQEYNLKNQAINNFKLKSFLVDTILPSAEPLNDRNKSLDFKVNNIQYDSYFKQYYFNIGTSKLYEYKNVLVITDEKFNTIGETFFPKLAYNLCFTEKYIYSFDYNYKSDSVIVDIFERPKFVTANGDSIKNIMNKIKEKSIAMMGEDKCANTNKLSEQNPITKYFHKIGVKDSNFLAICMYNDICPSCYYTILKNLAINQSFYNKVPLYLIIQGANTDQIRYQIKMEGLNNFKKIYIDSLSQYEKFDPYEEKSTRLVKIQKENILFDKNYLPGYQKELFIQLDSLLKFR